MKQVLMALIWALATAAMADDTIRYYDKHGRYTGKAVQSGHNTVRHYDSKGRYMGKDVQSGHAVRRYDNKGRLKGRYECPKDGHCLGF